MALVIEEYEIDGDNAVAASLSANFAVQPDAGNIWLVKGGWYFSDGVVDLSITAPASVTGRIANTQGGTIDMVVADKASSGSDGTTSTTTKSGTNRSPGIFAANISGAAFDSTAGAVKHGPNSAVTSRTTTSPGNVSANDSLAIHTTFMQRVGTYTYSFTNGAAELASIVAATSNQVSIHVGTKTVASGAAAVTGFQMDTGAATRLVAGQVVYNPTAVSPPTATMVKPSGAMNIYEGDTVLLEGSAADGATPYKNWSFSVVEGGSGTTPVTAQTGSMAFPNEGTWTLRLTVDGDDDQTSDPVDQTITVNAVGGMLLPQYFRR